MSVITVVNLSLSLSLTFFSRSIELKSHHLLPPYSYPILIRLCIFLIQRLSIECRGADADGEDIDGEDEKGEEGDEGKEEEEEEEEDIEGEGEEEKKERKLSKTEKSERRRRRDKDNGRFKPKDRMPQDLDSGQN
jgi:hypothetical protein